VLNFDAKWSKPLELVDGSAERLVYTLEDFEALPEIPGVYVFCRLWGSRPAKITPIYIGQAKNVRARVQQHTKSSVRLMNGIKSPDWGNGRRGVIWCTVSTRSKERQARMLDILERGLIEAALTKGFELLNIKLTKQHAHSITFSGNRVSEQLAPRRLLVRGL
jgi:hypothetical protein